jgi:hypothetical protein
MLAYMLIFGVALCSYAGAGVWCWPASAAGLVSLSWADHYLLYWRGSDLGLIDDIQDTFVRSTFNAVVATGAAYCLGLAVRLMAWPV